MKKVGIITFHASYNCGSMLQAYALQKVIQEEFGLENELINYSNEGQKEMYSTFAKIKKFRNLVGNFLKLVFYPILIRSKNDFEAFIKDHLVVGTKSYSKMEELKAVDGVYDFYICGSDQVWNTKAVDFDDAYFLNFVSKGKKIAYASSLGATNIIEKEEAKKHYQKLLSDFSAVSVREGNAKTIIEKIYEKPVNVTLDPTLLLSKEVWEETLINTKPLINGDYIFYYAFNYNEKVNQFVEEIGKKYNMPVVIVDARPWGPGLKFRYGFKLSKQYGPLGMLNLMRNAKLVFTTSFHGTVFSTIFEKKFWFVKSDMHNKNDQRATYLLNQLGLDERFVTIDRLKEIDLLGEVDYRNTKEKIDLLKKESIDFLRTSLV